MIRTAGRQSSAWDEYFVRKIFAVKRPKAIENDFEFIFYSFRHRLWRVLWKIDTNKIIPECIGQNNLFARLTIGFQQQKIMPNCKWIYEKWSEWETHGVFWWMHAQNTRKHPHSVCPFQKHSVFSIRCVCATFIEGQAAYIPPTGTSLFYAQLSRHGHTRTLYRIFRFVDNQKKKTKTEKTSAHSLLISSTVPIVSKRERDEHDRRNKVHTHTKWVSIPRRGAFKQRRVRIHPSTTDDTTESAMALATDESPLNGMRWRSV